jgi:hypothetical protein
MCLFLVILPIIQLIKLHDDVFSLDYKWCCVIPWFIIHHGWLYIILFKKKIVVLFKAAFVLYMFLRLRCKKHSKVFSDC